MINTKLQNIIDTKSAIGNAIVNKGGTITSETPFFNYAAQIDGISTGTPQTIFSASDGSKWALTNVVNLTNVSNNVTSDFNYWQPANNSTSDPILNVGTVGANISGNIQIVQVNQVNISQYVNIVATDIDGGKYVGYNGYDSQTNPTPTGNTTFNRWLLNNSATGTVIFANTTITNGGTFNGPNTTTNEANLGFINNTANYGATVNSVTTNNGFIYAGGGALSGTNRGVSKFNESTLSLVGNTGNYGGPIVSITTNNGSIYVGGETANLVRKYSEATLGIIGNTSSYNRAIYAVKTNNTFIFVGGEAFVGTNRGISKYRESNLAIVENSVNYGGDIQALAINNGFVYAGGSNNQKVKKYHESNLVFSAESNDYSGMIAALAINNGFIYVGGGPSTAVVKKYYESNLVFVGNTIGYGGDIVSVTTNNGFIYVGGRNDSSTLISTIQKFYESNLAFVGNSVNYGGGFNTLKTNNGFIYGGGDFNFSVVKYQESGLTLDNQTFYTATKIKE
jgi:hypothetical protein